MLDKLKKFLREMFSREQLDKIVDLMKKAQKYIGKGIDYVKKFIEWLYGGVKRLLGFKR
jgi:hypothetical protein